MDTWSRCIRGNDRGGRWTDPDDLPAEKVGYTMRDLDRLIPSTWPWATQITAAFNRIAAIPAPG